jgi:hypothetical protein
MRVKEEDGRFYVEPDTSDSEDRLRRWAEGRHLVDVVLAPARTTSATGRWHQAASPSLAAYADEPVHPQKPDLLALIQDERHPFSLEEAIALSREIERHPERPAAYWNSVIEALAERQRRWAMLGLPVAA